MEADCRADSKEYNNLHTRHHSLKYHLELWLLLEIKVTEFYCINLN
jgi:hypothetical protein